MTYGARARWTVKAGQRFGALTAVAYASEGRQSAIWRFRCDCNRAQILANKAVWEGKVLDCGCGANAVRQHANVGLVAPEQADPEQTATPTRFHDRISLKGLARLAQTQGIAVAVQAIVAHTREDATVFDGLTFEQLAEITLKCGISGTIDGLVAFAHAIHCAGNPERFATSTSAPSDGSTIRLLSSCVTN